MKLKYIFMSMAIAAVAMTGFSSCSDNDEVAPVPDDKTDLVLSADTRVKIGPENRVRIPIESGNGDYRAFSLAPEIADVVVENNEYYIEGFKNGTARIVVSDGANKYKQMIVSVYTTEVMSLNYSSLELTTLVGKAHNVTGFCVAEGNGNYSLTSSDPRVGATIDAETGEFVVNAAADENPYTAVVTVADQSGLTADLQVSVSKATHRVKIGTDTREALPVNKSDGEFEVEVVGSTAQLFTDDAGNPYIEGLENGTAVVKIMQGNKYREYTYSVYTTDVMKLSATSYELKTTLGVAVRVSPISVVEGNGGYTVSSNNDAVSASINADGLISLTVKSRLNDFTAVLTVTDCTGLTASANITVKSSLEPFSQEEIENIMTKGTSLYGECKDPSDGTQPYYYSYYTSYGYGEWFDTDEGDIHKLGWWMNQWGSDYGGLTVEYPKTAGVNEEVSGTLYYQYSYSAWYDKYSYNGTVKVLQDDASKIVVLFWNIDTANERINRAYFVKTR